MNAATYTADAPELRTVDATDWRDAVSEALASGRRFASLHALDEAGNATVRALFGGTQPLLLSCRSVDATVPSIIDIVPAAIWDEREAHDLYGVGFDGHTPLRPLVNHSAPLDDWVVPVHGHNPYDVAVGPIHAGVIESGHFRFHVVGERILQLDLRLFYKHRGLEKAAEGLNDHEAIRHVGRACAADHVAHTIAYAQAVESAGGLWPSVGLSDARTFLVELERVWNHLNDIAAICAGIGFAAGNMAFAALKERAQRLNDDLSGHRFLFDTVAVGASPFSLDRSSRDRAQAILRELRVDAASLWRELLFNSSFQARLGDVGVVSKSLAVELGMVGPAARASGHAVDARSDSPRLSYGAFQGAHPRERTGDVRARLEMRALELDDSFTILDELALRDLGGGTARAHASSSLIGASTVESARGASTCIVELAGGNVRRLRLRTSSYANWPAVAPAVVDNMLPDFPLINKSFELCYACVDR
ncbi:MAG TPA: NADH-quinone oxidoreductase subunit C [Gaiellaceae bacterium]